jgi:hypothetical protein
MENKAIKYNIPVQYRALVERLNLTDHDLEEPWLLTKEDEDRIIAVEVKSLKDRYEKKMLLLGIKNEDITKKLAEIDWESKLDKKEILEYANKCWNHSIWEKEQREKEKLEAEKAKQKLLEKCNAKYMYSLMSKTSKQKFGKDLIINENNKHLIKTICFFLSKDERFETELGYFFNKGLLIRGICGIGKTYLLKCVSDNELNPIDIFSMIEITEEIRRTGECKIKARKLIYLDDVGSEEHTINHYGTKISFFEDFIQRYYLNNKKFNNLIISTNNDFDEIAAKYGFRVRSRMKEMFNVIDVQGEDMRK